jgi:PAS domain S-box-containing protein
MRQSPWKQVWRQVSVYGNLIQQRVGPIALAIAVGLAYFLTARLSLLLMTQPGVAVFWPAAGVSSGTLIALGRAARWPVAVGVIAATITANLTGDRNVLSSSIFALSDAGEAMLVAWMIDRYVRSDFDLGRLHHVLALLAAAIVGTALSGIGGTLGYELAYNPDDPAWTVWRQWVASDAIGIIAVAPMIIGLVATLRAPLSRRELIEGVAALIVVAATAGIVIFMLPSDWWEMCVAVVLLFPAVLWVAARCQPVFASAAVFIVSLIVIGTVTFKLGNFGDTAPSIDDSIASAQITIVGTAFCALILSALFAERRQHEAVVAEGETRLQEALAAGAVMAFDWDSSTDLVRRSDNSAQILGLDPQQILDGKSFRARVHPDDLARMETLWSTLNRDNPTFAMAYRFLRLDGREVWLQEISKAEFDAAGRFVRLKGLKLDVTERKRAEERQKILTAELDHRVKNMLARVAAVAESMSQGSGSIAEFLRAFNGRIQSMAAAHTLLSQTGWQGANLTAVVRGQLAPYATDANTTIAGTDIILSQSAAQALAMVLHELVTNAVKYGALSIPSGQVSVSWDRRLNGGAAPNLIFVWRELSGPPVAPAIQSGYGSCLIRELIPHELGGSVDLAFGLDGACCRIEFPLA